VLDLSAPFDLNSELEEIDIHCAQFNKSQYAFSSLWSGLHDLLHFKRPIEGTRFAINVVEMVNNEKDTGFYAVSPLWAESNVLASHRLASLVLPKSRGSGFLDVARVRQKKKKSMVFFLFCFFIAFLDVSCQSSRKHRIVLAVSFSGKRPLYWFECKRCFERASSGR